MDLVQQHESPAERQTKIVEVLVLAFSELMVANPEAFGHKFRKIAAGPFTFYRGSVPLLFRSIEMVRVSSYLVEDHFQTLGLDKMR